jgi:hypothetical protein
MSFESDRRSGSGTSNRGGATEPLGPGKVTLTQGMGQGPGQGQGSMHPATTRDVSAAASSDHKVSAEASSARRPARSPARGPGDPAPKPGSGSALVVGAVEDQELAMDDKFTPLLMAAFKANPDLSFDDVLRLIASRAYEQHKGDPMSALHPTLAEYGQHAPSTEEPREAKKRAVLIGNQHYPSAPLYTPIADAAGMQSELSSRGYAAATHSDKAAADMATLWGSMVGSSDKGDDLVAYFAGHGERDGLVGVHPSRGMADVFTSAQVAGVVSSATGRGAHIRFILDSCHAGAQVQAVREVRENELATVASTVGDKVQVTAMIALREARERLLDHIGEGKKTARALDAMRSKQSARAPVRAGVTRDIDLVPIPPGHGVDRVHDTAAAAIWDQYVPVLNQLRKMVGFTQAPPPVADYTLAAQVKYLDDLWIAVSRSADRAKLGGDTRQAKSPKGR